MQRLSLHLLEASPKANLLKKSGERERSPVYRLATQTQGLNQRAVTCTVLAIQIIQQLAALVNHANQATTGMMVVLVLLEVGLQIIDLSRQQGNLHFRRTRVTLVTGELGYDLGFLLRG